MPDGMAIDESGGIWLAVIGAGKIVRLTPAGDEDLVLDVPMPWVSALLTGSP
jgi:sugar lactone lactonase YvrE